MATYRVTLTFEVQAPDADFALAVGYGAVAPELVGEAPVWPAEPAPGRVSLINVDVAEHQRRFVHPFSRQRQTKSAA